jgi:hypothetical protein
MTHTHTSKRFAAHPDVIACYGRRVSEIIRIMPSDKEYTLVSLALTPAKIVSKVSA